MSGWYRFTGAAGTQMPTSCQPDYYCGSDAPRWMDGTHPTLAQGLVTRRLCTRWTSSGGCCVASHSIQVRACPGNYYVYNLGIWDWCHSTYCGIDGEHKTHSNAHIHTQIHTNTHIQTNTHTYTVITEIFVRVKILYSSVCELSYAINFRTTRTVSHTLLFVQGFRMAQATASGCPQHDAPARSERLPLDKGKAVPLATQVRNNKGSTCMQRM